MPTHAVIDPESGRPIYFRQEMPFDLPILTYHVRREDGSYRDAELADIQPILEAGALKSIPQEDSAEAEALRQSGASAPIIRCAHHAGSAVARQYEERLAAAVAELNKQPEPAPA